MARLALVRRVVAFAATLLVATAAHAQLFRAYLASDGSDANPCTLQQPCRLLPAALNAITNGGEIWMLDSANFNTAPVSITKSVTILAIPGAVGSVVATGGSAIEVNTAGVAVALRNLVIAPLPAAGGTNGISMGAGAKLTVDSCLLANLPVHGILVSTAAIVQVSDSTIRDSGSRGMWLMAGARATISRTTISGSGGSAIEARGTTDSTMLVDIADSLIAGNFSGVSAWSMHAAGIVDLSIRDSRVVRNVSGNGVHGQSDLGAAVKVSASNNLVTHNMFGITASGAGTRIWVTGNTVSSNSSQGIGVNTPAIAESAGNNAVRNNSPDTYGTITPVAPI